MNGNIRNAMLVLRIKNGEAELIKELIVNNYDRVYKYIRFKTGDEHLSYDLTQEVFIRLINALEDYREQTYFNAFLMKIARNALADHFRSRREEVSLDEAEYNIPADVFEDVLSRKDAVRRALMRLPAEQRDAVLLKFVSGLKSREIAEITNVNVSTVKSRIHIGKEKLKILLKEEGIV